MKNFFKFLPVALAAFAVASCSNDELLSVNGEQELSLSPNELLVKMDGFSDATTRSGFMTTVADYTLRSALFFNGGDQMKMYHDATSWKPEIWTAQAFGQYKNATGTAVFKGSGSATITTEENAYGIYPATIGQFGNENRTSIQYDLSAMKFISYSAKDQDFTLSDGTVISAATEVTGNTKAYTAPFPLWGVKKSGEEIMTCQHLGGILRLDIAYLDNSTLAVDAFGNPTNARYIVIQSPNKLSGKVATAADLLNPTPAEEIDYANLMTKAPKLITQTATGTTALTAVPATTAAAFNDDVIVIRLTKGAPEHVMLFVPITAGNAGGEITVNVSKAVAIPTASPYTVDITGANAETAYTLTAADITAENEAQLSGFSSLTPAEQAKVQPGVFYRINDDSTNKNTTATSPFQMVQGIIAADKKAYRDFEMTFTQPILVDNTDLAPQRQWVDFTNTVANYGLGESYDLKHNVTVNVTFNGVGTDQILKFKNITGKTLTLNITQGTNPVNLQVENDLSSELVLEGDIIPNLYNYSNNQLTLKSSVIGGNVFTAGVMDIDRTVATTNLTILNNCAQVNVLNGEITNIAYAEKMKDNPNTGATGKFSGVNNIYTEGTAEIANINYSGVKTNGAAAAKLDWADGTTVSYTSKLTDNTFTPTALVTAITGTSKNGNVIVTATQLKGYDNTADARITASEIDLNGTAYTWSPLAALANNVDGNTVILPATSTKSVDPVSTAIKDLVMTPAGQTGLFASIGAVTVKNIEFDGVTVEGTVTGGENIGALAGEITGAATIDNIEVGGLNIAPTTSNNVISAGALAGYLSTTTAANITKVVTQGAITAYGNLGGIIGKVVKTGIVNFGKITNDTGTPVKSYITGVCNGSGVTLTVEKSNTLNSPYYARIGEYVGYVETDGSSTCGVTINLNSYTETARTLDAKAKADEINANHETSYHPIELNQSLVGFSGFYSGATLPITWTASGTGWALRVNVVAATKAANKAVATRYIYRTTQVTYPATTDVIFGKIVRE